jgi:YHS domain-containing protein
MKSDLYFADDQVRQTFLKLPSGRAEEKEIYDLLNIVFDTLAADPFCGTQVPKRLIPPDISHKIPDRQPVEI